MGASGMVRIPNELIDPIKKLVTLWRSGDAAKVEEAINRIASGGASAELPSEISPLAERMTRALETIALNSAPDIVSRERLMQIYGLNLKELSLQARGQTRIIDILIAEKTGWRSLSDGSFVRPEKDMG
jgi:hypothetical protein